MAVGWSGYLNKLLDNLFGVQIPQALSAAPWDETPGIVNLPADPADRDVRAAADPRCQRVGPVNTVMVMIKLGVLVLFVVIAFTAFNADHFADFGTPASPASRCGERHHLLLLHRPGRRLHRR